MGKTGYCTKDFIAIEKFLSSLIEKVKHEDITSQEAFEVWKLLNMVKGICLKDSPQHVKMLSLWYRTVFDLLKEGRAGYFIETLPTDSAFFYRWPWEELKGIKESLKILPEQKKRQKIQFKTDLSFENVSFTDIYLPDSNNEMQLYRCGLYDLLSGESRSTENPAKRTFDGKEIARLSQMNDITEDEADWIYDYFLWFDCQDAARFDSSPLDIWFDSVRRRLKKGMRGNFITTVYIYLPERSIKSIIKLLPQEDLFSRAIICKNGEMTDIREERAGMLKKRLPSRNALRRVYSWGQYINSPEEHEKFFKRYVDLNSETIKLEALRIAGLSFTAAGFIDTTHRVLLYDIMSDDDIVKETLMHQESSELMPASEALEIMIEKITERKMRLESEQNDSWIDIIR